MPLPEILKKKVDKSLTEFCQHRIPPRVRDKIRLEIEYRGNTTTLVERRPVWNDSDAEWTKSKVAQFRFDDSRMTWSLFCRDSRGKWHPYRSAPTSADFDSLVAEVDRDPTGIFWG